MGVGGVNRAAFQGQQVQNTQKTQRKASTKSAQQLDGKQFGQIKAQVKLPMTNVNALTQLPSKDQQKLMNMNQDNKLGKLVKNLSTARKQLQTDVLPRSLLGAGQTIPPAPMRAMAATMGKLFAGRDFEIEIGTEQTNMSFRVGGKSFNVTMDSLLKKGLKIQEDDDEDDIEESL